MIAGGLALAGLAPALEPAPADAQFQKDVQSLLAAPHRLAGSEAGRRAGDYLKAQLQGLPGKLLTQSFRFPQEIVAVCELRSDGRVIPLLPLKADGLQSCVTPPEGITGRIISLGGPYSGNPVKALDGLKPGEAWIALADFNQKDAVNIAFQFGAGAIIFVGGDAMDRNFLPDKETHVSVSFPRFYISAGQAAAVKPAALKQATLFSRIAWQERMGCNIVWLINGTYPVFADKRPEAIILSAPYDSRGIVPGNAPEPERAANCAALLAVARQLAAQPPKRDVIIAFFDNHANFLEGGRNFYAALRLAIKDGISDPWPKRQIFIEQERANIRGQLDCMNQADLVATDHPMRQQVVQLLKEESRHAYDEYQKDVTAIRRKLHAPETDKAALPDLQRRCDSLLTDQRQWQTIRENLRDSRSIAPDCQARFQHLLGDMRNLHQRRLAELDEQEEYVAESAALGDLLSTHSIVLHASFRFNAGGTRWLFRPHGTSRKTFFVQLLEAAAKDRDADWRQACGFSWESRPVWEMAASLNMAANDNALSPWATYEEACLASVYDIPGMTLVTDQDRAAHAYLPDASLRPDELECINRQAAACLPFLREAADGAWASIPWWILRNTKSTLELYQWRDDRADGHAVKAFAYGQTQAGKLVPNAVVHILNRGDEGAAYETRRDYLTLTDVNGIFPLIPLYPAPDDGGFRADVIESALFDADGRITHMSTLNVNGGYGSVQAGWEKAGAFQSRIQSGFYAIIPLFEGMGGRIVGSTMPYRNVLQPQGMALLNSLNNSPYARLHFRYDPQDGAGVYFVDNPMGIKLIYRDPYDTDNAGIYVNPTDTHRAGAGYGPGRASGQGKAGDVLSLRREGARDIFTLNEQRLSVLRRKNIVLNSLEYLHNRGKFYLAEMGRAAAAKQTDRTLRLSDRVVAFERRVYQPVIATTNDMVVAATLLLLIAMPFTFALQSLVFPTHNIYRRIATFVLIFIATYAVLYIVHPAFSLSATPSIIILAFMLLTMSGMVIFILMTKFKYEVKQLQGQATTAHAFEQSAVGNVGAAVALAVSTMRRRPVRTALTIVTVVMLTFTVTSFVSFQSERGVNTYYKGPGDAVSRILIRHAAWKSLPANLEQEIADFVGPAAAAIHSRYWRVTELSLDPNPGDLNIPLRHSNGRSVSAAAVMSLAEPELARIPGFSGVLQATPETLTAFYRGTGVFLAPGLITALGATTGDVVRINGYELTVLGAIKSEALLDLRQIDGSPLLPVNFRMTRMAAGEYEYKGSASSGNPAAELEQLLSTLAPEAMEPISPDTLIVAAPELAQRLGAALKAVVVFCKPGVDLEALANDLAVVMDVPVFVNRGGERQQKSFGDRYGISGLQAVLIPLLLGGLIVFSTMLGSVIDREKEIYTFSALGLSPRAIAALFFFEAGIYAVLGGFGGYLLSQVATFTMEQLAQFGWLRAPEMNYSSSAAVNTILMVMAVVMGSTIYPAFAAARKATAETTSAWKVPAPEGNLCRFDFPFTISSHDIGGVLYFIREYFGEHADRTVGAFAASEIRLGRDSAVALPRLSATIWLQPFDQGLSQHFVISAGRSEIPEVCSIRIAMERLSGQPSAWRRSYAVFLERLRAQFLIWRTLDDESRERYLAMDERSGRA